MPPKLHQNHQTRPRKHRAYTTMYAATAPTLGTSPYPRTRHPEAETEKRASAPRNDAPVHDRWGEIGSIDSEINRRRAGPGGGGGGGGDAKALVTSLGCGYGAEGGRDGEVSSVQSNREGAGLDGGWLYFASSCTSSRLASPVAQGTQGNDGEERETGG